MGICRSRYVDFYVYARESDHRMGSLIWASLPVLAELHWAKEKANRVKSERKTENQSSIISINSCILHPYFNFAAAGYSSQHKDILIDYTPPKGSMKLDVSLSPFPF